MNNPKKISRRIDVLTGTKEQKAYDYARDVLPLLDKTIEQSRSILAARTVDGVYYPSRYVTHKTFTSPDERLQELTSLTLVLLTNDESLIIAHMNDAVKPIMRLGTRTSYYEFLAGITLYYDASWLITYNDYDGVAVCDYIKSVTGVMPTVLSTTHTLDTVSPPLLGTEPTDTVDDELKVHVLLKVEHPDMGILRLTATCAKP